MGLFKPDLYRNFAIGFLIGVLAVGIGATPDWQAEFSGKAHAAEASVSTLERVAVNAPDSGRLMQVK